MPAQRAIRSFLALILALTLAAAATFVAVGLVAAAPAEAGSGSDEALFVQLINQTRSSAGLEPLTVHPELVAQARSWSSTMAGADQLSHSPNVASGISAPWTVLGENVGVHQIVDVQALHAAFVASPSHYANIVDPRYRYIGVGVVVTEAGKLWTTHRFMATAAPSTTAPPATTVPPTTAPPTTQAAPPPTSPPTTAASPPPSIPAPDGTTTSTAPPAPSPAEPSAPAADPSASSPTTPPTTAPSDDGASRPADDPADGDLNVDVDVDVDVDDSAVGPGQPDVETVEQMLIELIDAGI